KRYNDTYGHLAGDDCLKKVAKALRSSVSRPADMVARYGGEEFICVLPETDAEGARSVAVNIQQEIAALRIPHENS
ncbi:MAG: diguanylate cyclase, partial [Desulfamplus sp.]|nr:diguanylate cyclase [Desulfamplus sp.]